MWPRGRSTWARTSEPLWPTAAPLIDNGEIPASFPNGYAAFYCMKYPYIARGQYAAFLNTLTRTQANERFHVDGHGRWIDRSGVPSDYAYSVSTPAKACPWLSWTDCAAYAAWAALRPMTELEWEKAVRGPQDPVPNDVWLSYWGIAELGNPTLCERPVSIGSAVGRKFAGTHGRGTPALPPDWPANVGGAVFRGAPSPQNHLGTSGRTDTRDADADRSLHPFAGWRGARTAPAQAAAVGQAAGMPEARRVRPVTRLDRGVRADGVLDEWSKPALTLSGPADLFPVYCRFVPFDFYGRLLKPWQGIADMDAKVYLGWDGEALCVAAEVTDDRHFNTKSSENIWNGDALQMGLVNAKGVHWNVGLALTKAGVAFHQWQGKGDTLAKTAGCAVVRDEKARITRYELRLPLVALGLTPGEEFRLNIMFFDDDEGNGHRYRLQLAPGLAPGGLPRAGNCALFPRFILEK